MKQSTEFINPPYYNKPLTIAQMKQAKDLLDYYKHVLVCSQCRIVYGIDYVGKLLELQIRKEENICPICEENNNGQGMSRWREQSRKVRDNGTNT